MGWEGLGRVASCRWYGLGIGHSYVLRFPSYDKPHENKYADRRLAVDTLSALPHTLSCQHECWPQAKEPEPMRTFKLYLSFAFLGFAIAALGASLGVLLAVIL